MPHFSQCYPQKLQPNAVSDATVRQQERVSDPVCPAQRAPPSFLPNPGPVDSNEFILMVEYELDIVRVPHHNADVRDVRMSSASSTVASAQIPFRMPTRSPALA